MVWCISLTLTFKRLLIDTRVFTERRTLSLKDTEHFKTCEHFNQVPIFEVSDVKIINSKDQRRMNKRTDLYNLKDIQIIPENEPINLIAR